MNRSQTVLFCSHSRAPTCDALVFFGVAGWAQRDVVGTAALGQVGGQNLGPVAAARPEFDDRHLGFDTKEGELLRRMARLVAGDESSRPSRVRNGGRQRGIWGSGGGRCRGDDGARAHCKRGGRQQRQSRNDVFHGRQFLEPCICNAVSQIRQPVGGVSQEQDIGVGSWFAFSSIFQRL